MSGERRPLTDRYVRGLAAGDGDVIHWDRDLRGFGVRVYPSGAKVYVVQSRGPGGPRRVAVGRHGVVSARTARRRAAAALARIKAGEEPVPGTPARADSGPTVAELAERYFREHVAVRCKPATARIHRHTVDRHVLPALGGRRLSELRREHVAALHRGLRDRPWTANEAVAALSRMLNKAEAWDLAPAGGNPCRFVARYRRRRPERFLTGEEFRRLGRALNGMEAEGRLRAHAAAAIRLLMLTGCRCGEILGLQWRDVHLEARELRLRDSKTGPRAVPLSPAAARVLEGLPRVAGNPWVVAGRRPGRPLSQIAYPWQRVRARAGLEDVRLHDLRHSFASRALALGESLPTIGKLLGHGRIRTTARYAHLARDSVGASAAKVAASIGADILPDGFGTDPPDRAPRAPSPARGRGTG